MIRARPLPPRSPRRWTWLALAVSVALPGPRAAVAQEARTPAETAAETAPELPEGRTFRGDRGELRVPAVRLAEPDVTVDGRLEEDAWERAAWLTGFTQYEPREGVPASAPTQVAVFYTEDAVYFGIRALDEDPAGIQATVAERDESVFNDDWIRIMLDTFGDRRRAYLFYINPLGIQTDGFWLEGKQTEFGLPIDFNPDFIWESRGRVGPEGWTAEIRIPYVSLQFEDRPVQEWGLNVAREVKRRGFKQSWAPLTKERASTLVQSGTLTGLRDLAPRRLVEVNPVTTARVTGARDERDFRYGDLEPEFGLDARMGLTRNLTLSATFNPDFSQVEADADQISVNERFAIFFPEKRRFFLEGAEIFESPTRLVHTRRVVDPIGGAKVAGKVGPVSLAWLGAVDESPVQLGESDTEALFNMVRLRRDVGRASSVGLLVTDRSFPGEGRYNRVAAADGRVFLDARHTITAQAGGSWTSSGPESPAEFGPLLTLSAARAGRTFGWEARVEDVAPDFRTESGFIRRTGDLRTFLTGGLTFYGDSGATLERWGFEGRFDGFYDHDDFWSGREASPFEHEVELQANLFFRGDRSISPLVRLGYFRFRPSDFEGYAIEGPEGSMRPFPVPEPLTPMWAGGFRGRGRVSAAVQAEARAYLREIPIFAEGGLGRELLISPELQLQPTPAFSVDLSYAFSRLWRVRDGSHFSSADIPRLEAQYQFSRALFVRFIGQYDLEWRDALRDPRGDRPILVDGERAVTREGGNFQGQVLVSYEPSPGTIFFVGWSRIMEGDRTLAVSEMERTSEAFFAKLSYLHRF